jgi:hypothetical protein
MLNSPFNNLILISDNKLAKERKHLGDSVPVTIDPHIVSRRPKSVLTTEVVKVLKKRDKNHQSHPADSYPHCARVDIESSRVENSLSDINKLQKEKQSKLRSKSVEMSEAWYQGMGDRGGHQLRPSGREDSRGDRKPYHSMPMLNSDMGYDPGPLRGEDSPRRDAARQYQSGPHVDTMDDPYRGYDRRGSPEDREQNRPGQISEEGNEYYRERHLPHGDVQKRHESNCSEDLGRNDEPQGGRMRGDGRIYQPAHAADYR